MKTIVAMLLLVEALVDAKCYLPDGTGATNPQWRECSTDPKDPLSNICCALNRTNPAGGLRSDGDTADTCLPNGLCQNESIMDNANKSITYRRSYCTSQQWESGNCLTTCGKGGAGFKDMTPCDGTPSSERWCCGTDTSCCSDPKGAVVILAKKFLDASPTTVIGTAQPTSSASRSTVSSAPSASSSSGGSQTPTPSSGASNTPSGPSSNTSSQDSEGLSTGAKVGIAVGAVIGGLALVGIGAWLALASQRRNKTGGSHPRNQPELDGFGVDQKQSYLLQDNAVYEASSQNHSYPASMHSKHHEVAVPLGELPDHQVPTELPGDDGKPVKGRHW